LISIHKARYDIPQRAKERGAGKQYTRRDRTRVTLVDSKNLHYYSYFKEWCRGHEIWGWCFHNKTDGRFGCDEDAFCAGQEQLKNKKSTGCFLRENNTDGCNLGFIPTPPKYAVGQQCVNSLEEPGEDLKLFKSCDDPCSGQLAQILQESEPGSPTTVQRGCRSRKTLMHHISKDQHTKFKNNTNWMDTERLVELPSCSDITLDVEYVNGTQSMCLDFTFEVRCSKR
uniref:Thyroglobulin type-1 domain-containing protein n=1 Tax=Nippostrongylus brasiliensis TaxID=27835 RepID=A0A0N4XT48_NIPBR